MDGRKQGRKEGWKMLNLMMHSTYFYFANKTFDSNESTGFFFLPPSPLLRLCINNLIIY